jgi:hypothetical protein
MIPPLCEFSSAVFVVFWISAFHYRAIRDFICRFWRSGACLRALGSPPRSTRPLHLELVFQSRTLAEPTPWPLAPPITANGQLCREHQLMQPRPTCDQPQPRPRGKTSHWHLEGRHPGTSPSVLNQSQKIEEQTNRWKSV